MKKLLERGADPNLADKTDRENQPFYDYGGPFSNCLTETPLHKMIKTAIGARSYEGRDIEKDLNVINILLSHGARLTSDNESFASLLCKGEKPEVSALLKRERPEEMKQLQQVWQRAQRSPEEKEAEDLLNKNGGSELMVAIEIGNQVKVKELLGRAAKEGKAKEILNFQYMRGSDGTPLAKAARRGDLEMMDMLLEAGADPNMKFYPPRSTYGVSTFVAVVQSHVSPYELPREIRDLRNDILNKLLKAGVNIKDVVLGEVKSFSSPVNFGLWTFLLEAGADVDKPSMSGQSSLVSAACYGKLDEVKFLLDKGANIKAKDKKGRTALHEAVHESREEVIQVLIERGADKDAMDFEGFTPLALAVKGKKMTGTNLAGLKLLIASGADVNKQNPNSGDTPLLLCFKEKPDWTIANQIDSLLKAGADPRIADNDGKTAAELWAENQNIVEKHVGPHTYRNVAENLEKCISELNAGDV